MSLNTVIWHFWQQPWFAVFTRQLAELVQALYPEGWSGMVRKSSDKSSNTDKSNDIEKQLSPGKTSTTGGDDWCSAVEKVCSNTPLGLKWQDLSLSRGAKWQCQPMSSGWGIRKLTKSLSTNKVNRPARNGDWHLQCLDREDYRESRKELQWWIDEPADLLCWCLIEFALRVE